MFDSSKCLCILTGTCLANRPCANNGTCVLGSSPDRYTCDCTGTNFIRVNCLGKMLRIKMISSNSILLNV